MCKIQKEILPSFFKQLIGLPSWNVRQGHGSFLTLDFGEPSLEIREPNLNAKSAVFHRRRVTVIGSYHIWIEQCNWLIKNEGKIHADSEFSKEVIDKALSQIDGSHLVEVEIDPENKTSVFSFEFGSKIVMTAYLESDQEDPIWHLHTPNKTLSYLSSGEVEIGNRDGSEQTHKRLGKTIFSLNPMAR